MAFARVHPAQTPCLPALAACARQAAAKGARGFFRRAMRYCPSVQTDFSRQPLGVRRIFETCLGARTLPARHQLAHPFGTDHAPQYRALFWGYQQTAVLLKITLRLNNSGIRPMHRASQPGSTQAYQARGEPGRTGWDGASTLSLACQRRRVSACRSLAAPGGFQARCG